ncbi:slipin family protein, partial [Streptomyces sp. NPDC002698]
QASKKLAEAAGVMSEQPAALQLRLLQTVVAVAAEKNSTLVLPFPVELLRFLERAQSGQPPTVAQPQPQPQPQPGSGSGSELEPEPERTPGAPPAVERQPRTEPE